MKGFHANRDYLLEKIISNEVPSRLAKEMFRDKKEYFQFSGLIL